MLQKRNDLEIVGLLRRGSSHVRQMSESLGMVPSTVMRTVQRLEKEGVVDFKQAGKNKTYSLKNTLEAQQYLYMTEHYQLLKILQDPQLRRVICQLKDNTESQLVVLFGSHATGTANKNSDIDVFVETRDKDLKEKLTALSEKLSIKIGKLDKDNLLTKEIIKKHVILQNVERFYQAIR